MKRDEFLRHCETLSKEELHQLAQADRNRGLPIPPEVQAMFHSLDDQIPAEEFWLKTACTPDPRGTHIFVLKPVPPTSTPLPVVINVHGGGWCKPHSDRDLYFCRRLVKALGYLVVDVDYVLAPEYPYPAALEEIEALLNELPRLLPQWGGDPQNVVFCGQSAGGNLLGGVSHRKRYTKELTVKAQILAYPPCDNFTSHFGDEDLDERGMATEYYGFYYNQSIEERKNTDVSLTFATEADLTGLPPTDIITGGLDNLCPEGKRYFDLLQAHGVPSTYRCFEKSRHGFVVNLMDQWQEGESYILSLLKEHFAR